MPRILQGLQVTCHKLATSRLAQLSLSPNSSSTTIFSLTPPRALQVNTTPISLLAQQQNPIRTADTIKSSQCEMSERGHQRGGRGGGRGEHRGGRGGGGRGAHAGGERERPKKENILDLGKYMDKKITVKFTGGREVTGTLKGYDALMNLVLDDVDEILRDDEGNTSTRALGLVVARGTLLVLVSPVDGSEEIANPFVQAEE